MLDGIVSFLLWTVLVLAGFAILYTLNLIFKFHRRKSLIVDKKYLGPLFDTELSVTEAATGENGDLSINDVCFNGNFNFQSLIDTILVDIS